jgi:hypothetical protein
MIPQRLLEAAEGFAGGALNDDLAIVAVIRETANNAPVERSISESHSDIGHDDVNDTAIEDAVNAGDGSIMNLISELESGIDLNEVNVVSIKSSELTVINGGLAEVDEPEIDYENLPIEEMIKLGIIETDVSLGPDDDYDMMPGGLNPNDLATDNLTSDNTEIAVEDDRFAGSRASIAGDSDLGASAGSNDNDELAKLAYEALASLAEPESTETGIDVLDYKPEIVEPGIKAPILTAVPSVAPSSENDLSDKEPAPDLDNPSVESKTIKASKTAKQTSKQTPKKSGKSKETSSKQANKSATDVNAVTAKTAKSAKPKATGAAKSKTTASKKKNQDKAV